MTEVTTDSIIETIEEQMVKHQQLASAQKAVIENSEDTEEQQTALQMFSKHMGALTALDKLRTVYAEDEADDVNDD